MTDAVPSAQAPNLDAPTHRRDFGWCRIMRCASGHAKRQEIALRNVHEPGPQTCGPFTRVELHLHLIA